MKFWSPEDFEVSHFENILKGRINKTRNYNGSDETGLCKYKYNEFGFRADSIYKEGFKIMSIGCSNTEGVGVEMEQSWPAQLANLFPNGVNVNLSVGGRSNDFIARALLSYYDYFKPDLVLIMYTETHRRDYFTPIGGVEPFHHSAWGYFSKTEKGIEEHKALLTLLNKEANLQNWYKNHLLIKYFLECKQAKWLWDGWFATDKYRDDNRFDGDFYPYLDKGVDNTHPGPITHKTYSNKIYDYINYKFPNK